MKPLKIAGIVLLLIVATAGGQGGQELGLTIPVRITGPLDHPAYRIEFSALAGGEGQGGGEDKNSRMSC